MVGVKRRTRVACLLCSSLKKKCNGKSPCKRCRERGVVCTYAPSRAHASSPAGQRALQAVKDNRDMWAHLNKQLGEMRSQSAALAHERDMLQGLLRSVLAAGTHVGNPFAHTPYYTLCDYSWEHGKDDMGLTTTLYVSPALLSVIGGRVEDYVGDTMFNNMRRKDMEQVMMCVGEQWGEQHMHLGKDTFTVETPALSQVIVARDGSRATEMRSRYRVSRAGMTCRVVQHVDPSSLRRLADIPRTLREEGGMAVWQGCKPGESACGDMCAHVDAQGALLDAGSMAHGEAGASEDSASVGGDWGNVEVVLEKEGAEDAMWAAAGVHVSVGGEVLTGGDTPPPAPMWDTAPMLAGVDMPPTPTVPQAQGTLWDTTPAGVTW